MRIYPPVPTEEAIESLKAYAKVVWGDSPPVDEDTIVRLAEAMSIVSSINVEPDDLDPGFP